MIRSLSHGDFIAERELALALLSGVLLVLILPQWTIILAFMVLMIMTVLTLKPKVLRQLGRSLIWPFGFVSFSCVTLLFRWDPVHVVGWDLSALPRTIQTLSRGLAGSFLLLLLPHVMPAARWFEYATTLNLDRLLVSLFVYSNRWLHLLGQSVQWLNLGWQLRSGPYRGFGLLEVTGWRMARLFRLVEARSRAIEIGLAVRGLEPILPPIQGQPYFWNKGILCRLFLPHMLSSIAAIFWFW